MTGLETIEVQCPYCWERIEVVVDTSVEEQRYIEDCSVCCRPILFEVTVDSGGFPFVTARSEEE
ncbi:CPXCG motif-containing cysteine-rich protein [Endothiovibrio diazotrophicus]